MLNITLKGTYQDSSGFNWDYYGDDRNPSQFYIVPRPQFVFQDGKPSFRITRYSTGNVASNGAGFCRFDIELSVPAAVEQAVSGQIPQFFPGAKQPYAFVSLNYNQGGKAYFDFASGSDTITFAAPVSSFGSNVASFQLPMTKQQLDTVVGAFSADGGAFEVEYHLSVPARLPSVTAVLSFDSSLAFQYQVTQPSYDGWGDETSPGSVQTLLNESAASKVEITWGTANPSASLRQAVADWANGTLANLVTTEVQKTIALQGLKSDSSFNISEVSSFTSTYSENMVIDWIIAPRAALPSFPMLGLEIGSFTAAVDERQQQMTVSAFLPFSADSADATLPDGKPQALVDHVTVTVSYPGLDQSQATYTFKSNESHTFIAPYDANAGPNWSIDYTVTYVDKGTPAVTTTKPVPVTAGAYTLQVLQAGLLSVLFDAQQAFASEGTKPVEIDIALSFINSDGSGQLIQQLAKIRSTDNPQQATITSYYPVPISNGYNYQVTYVYPGGLQYQAPLVQGQTGFSQTIPAADAVHSCNLIVFVSAADTASNPLLDGPTVQMYYAQEPSTLPPGVSTEPTVNSPAVFNIPLATTSTSATIGRATFVGLLSGDQPLVYSASLDMANGQIDIDATLVENDQASILVTPTQRYFTLQIDPAAINWSTAAFDSVQVLVTASIAQGTGPKPPDQPQQRSVAWNKGESGSKYITYSIQDGNTVSYSWVASYITPGHAVKSAQQTSSNIVLEIPAFPPAAAAALRRARA